MYSKIDCQRQVLAFIDQDQTALNNEMEKLELNDVSNREAVAARYYFKALFGKEFSRAHEDGLNAALNYGYAVLLSLVDRHIVANGYLTEIGIHHGSMENAYNLGSDLMEPFRPVFDQWVSQQSFDELTPNVKFMIVDVLNVVITYNDKQELLRNAIAKHVTNCLRYLGGELDDLTIEVKLPSEVSNRALNDHV